MRRFQVLLLAASGMLVAAPASAQAVRTWVSGVGNDANPCSRTEPCKSFAGALAKTGSGGEINVIDPGGYGTVTITKSLSINGRGVAGIANNLSAGIIVAAGPTDVVNLRGLVIDGAGGSTGIVGVRYTSGGALHIQNSVIRDARAGGAGTNHGILVNPTGGDLVLDISDTVLEDNGTSVTGGAGLMIRPTGAANVKANLTRVQTQNNRTGVYVDGDSGTGTVNVTIRDSDISGNQVEGVRAFSPNGGDALVQVLVMGSAVSNNGAQGLQSVGQRATIRVGGSGVTGNLGAGLQANNGGTLASYRTNFTDGNGAPNVGDTTATPN